MIQYFDCKGYAQIEPSQVWFTRAGMSESQCFLDDTKFAEHFPMTPSEVADGKMVAENGCFLMIDKDRKLATVPNTDMSKLGYKMGINYSTERIYNQYTPGRRNFCMVAGEYLPRIGFTEPGMRICTNAVAWDSAKIGTILTGVTVTGTSKIDSADSKAVYDGVKTYLAARAESTTPETVAPIYVAVTDDSEGRLQIVSKADAISKGLGNVYGIITEAYNNADMTLSFKIMFVNKPEA